MDENPINLIIEINYENAKFKLEREEEISYNELKEESIKYFNIEIKNGDNIEFIYADEDNEKNILEHNNEDIFSSSNYINDNYRLYLDLIIVNNQKPNVENKINENKEEVNIISNNNYNDNNCISQGKREENKEIKTSNSEIENKLRQFGSLFKRQFYTIQKDISKMINRKYKEIENELSKLNKQVNNINSNLNIPRSKNKKENKSKRNERQANNLQNFSDINQIIENSNETELGRCSTFSHFTKEFNDFEFINMKKNKNVDDFYNYSEHSDEDDEEDNNINKVDGNHDSKINKKSDPKMDKIRKYINKLYKKKNYEYTDIVARGNKIFEIMNGKDITMKVNEVNKHIKKYLTEGKKQSLSVKEKIKYYYILKYLNHFLEIKQVQKTLDDKLKQEIENQIKEEKTKQNEAENISVEKLTSLLNSIIKNNNKIYVQEKLKEIFTGTNLEINKSKVEDYIY